MIQRGNKRLEVFQRIDIQQHEGARAWITKRKVADTE